MTNVTGSTDGKDQDMVEVFKGIVPPWLNTKSSTWFVGSPQVQV